MPKTNIEELKAALRQLAKEYQPFDNTLYETLKHGIKDGVFTVDLARPSVRILLRKAMQGAAFRQGAFEILVSAVSAEQEPEIAAATMEALLSIDRHDDHVDYYEAFLCLAEMLRQPTMHSSAVTLLKSAAVAFDGGYEYILIDALGSLREKDELGKHTLEILLHVIDGVGMSFRRLDYFRILSDCITKNMFGVVTFDELAPIWKAVQAELLKERVVDLANVSEDPKEVGWTLIREAHTAKFGQARLPATHIDMDFVFESAHILLYLKFLNRAAPIPDEITSLPLPVQQVYDAAIDNAFAKRRLDALDQNRWPM
jgi:hypothetical protein